MRRVTVVRFEITDQSHSPGSLAAWVSPNSEVQVNGAGQCFPNCASGRVLSHHGPRSPGRGDSDEVEPLNLKTGSVTVVNCGQSLAPSQLVTEARNPPAAGRGRAAPARPGPGPAPGPRRALGNLKSDSQSGRAEIRARPRAGTLARPSHSSGNPYPFASFIHLSSTRDKTWISQMQMI